MFPLSHGCSRGLYKTARLKVIDAAGKAHLFAGAPGPAVTLRLHDRVRCPLKIFLKPGTRPLVSLRGRDAHL